MSSWNELPQVKSLPATQTAQATSHFQVPVITTPFSSGTRFKSNDETVKDSSSSSAARIDASFVPPTSNLQVFNTQAEKDKASIPAGSQVFIREGAVDYLDIVSVVKENGEEDLVEAQLTEMNLLACGHAFTTRTLIQLNDSVCPNCRAPIHGNNLSNLLLRIYSELREINRITAILKDSIIAIAAASLPTIPDELYQLNLKDLASRFRNDLTTDLLNSIRRVEEMIESVDKLRAVALQVD